MPIQTKEYLKSKFEQGDRPSAQDFIDLIDSLEDGTAISEHASKTVAAHGGIIADSDPRLSDARSPLPHNHNSDYYTKQECDASIQSIIGMPPEDLNTMQELAARLQNEESELGTVVSALSAKANSADVYTKSEADTKFGSSIPTGTIFRSGPVVPENSFVCNGALLNKLTNAALYAEIGDSYNYLANQYDNGQPWRQQYNSNDSGYISPVFTTAPISLPAALQFATIFVTNNYLYILGGRISTTAQNTIYRSFINADGTLSAFELIGNTTDTLYAGTAVLIKNYVYVFSSFVNGVASRNIYRATVYDDGTISAFSLYGSTINAWSNGTAFVTKNRVHIMLCDSQPGSMHAPINADGSLGNWASGISTSAGHTNGCIVQTPSRIYWFGGYAGSDAFVSLINSDGTLAGWTTSPVALPATVNQYSSAVVTNNNFYIYRPNYTSNVMISGILNSDGTVASMKTETTTIPTALSNATIHTVVTSSKFYLFGGQVTTMYVMDFIGGSNNYLQQTYTTPELTDSFFIPDMRKEDWNYPNDSIRYYIKG